MVYLVKIWTPHSDLQGTRILGKTFIQWTMIQLILATGVFISL